MKPINVSDEALNSLMQVCQGDYLAHGEMRSVLDLFTRQLQQTPDATAVWEPNRVISFAQLDRWSDQIAHQLRENRIASGERVGICLPRSARLVAALIGVLKNGCAFVPMDVRHPSHRIEFQMRDAQTCRVLTLDATISRLPALTQQSLVPWDWPDCQRAASVAPSPKFSLTENSTAYVMYTSGSTGQPKGVEVSHHGLLNYVAWCDRVYAADGPLSFSFFTSISFDLTLTSLFTPLTTGGAIVVHLEEAKENLADILKDDRVNAVKLTPSHLRLLQGNPELGNRLELLVVGGENLTRSLAAFAQSLLGPQGRLYNEYGPTEATVGCLVHKYDVLKDIAASVPVGRPISNTSAYVLREDLRPVNFNEVGELYLSGDSLATGYLNRPELTADKFIPHPFSQTPGARLYKTGDLARYLNDGTIEFLGRIDNQVKIRGFRIELGEIEGVLEQHQAVQQAVVMVQEDQPDKKQLVAYLVFTRDCSPSVGELRDFLKQQLPEYMMPARFVTLKTMPLSFNGKIDRQALPSPEKLRSDLTEIFVAPRNELELQLTQIWEEVLAFKPIGVKDNFFELGGHSLLAVPLFQKISQRFGQNLPIETLFKAPNIEKLAKFIDEKREPNFKKFLRPIQANGSKAPIFWFPSGGTIGSGMGLMRLATLIDSERPFFAFQFEDIEKKYQESRAVEEIANLVIKEIQTIQPEGPYFLLGHCVGGIFAFEIAQQLQAKEQKVALLGLLNTYAPAPTSSSNSPLLPYQSLLSLRDRIAFQWSKINSLHWTEKLRYITDRFKWRLTRISYQFFQPSESLPSTMHYLNSEEISLKATKNYVPRTSPSKLVIFRSKIQMGEPDSDLGWSHLTTGELEVKEIPGHFTDLLSTEKQIQYVATELREVVTQANKILN